MIKLYRYNGFGGKVEANESPLDAAKRELEVKYPRLKELVVRYLL